MVLTESKLSTEQLLSFSFFILLSNTFIFFPLSLWCLMRGCVSHETYDSQVVVLWDANDSLETTKSNDETILSLLSYRNHIFMSIQRGWKFNWEIGHQSTDRMPQGERLVNAILSDQRPVRSHKHHLGQKSGNIYQDP